MKKTIKFKSPIQIRSRLLKDGYQSLYLDIYISSTKKRIRENLKLMLIPEIKPADKVTNQGTLRKAEMIRLQRLEDLENGVFDTDKSATDKDKDILLIDLLDELTDKREAYLTLKSILVAQNKKYKVSEYTPKLVNEFIKFISGEKKCGCTTKLKNSSIIEYVHLLKSLFYYAIRKGIINCNPVCMIEKSDLPKKINKEPTYLTEDEIQL